MGRKQDLFSQKQIYSLPQAVSCMKPEWKQAKGGCFVGRARSPL
jgi:hypothetical protein